MITDLRFAPSKFITACETATITVTATDPDGDALGAAWVIVAQPAGSAARLVPSGFSVIFTPDLIGDYTLRGY